MRSTVVTGVTWTAFIFAIYLFLGFRPAPPQTIGEGEVCFKCHRVITNARLAAEMMDRNLPTKYKTAGCMAAYVATENPGSSKPSMPGSCRSSSTTGPTSTTIARTTRAAWRASPRRSWVCRWSAGTR